MPIKIEKKRSYKPHVDALEGARTLLEFSKEIRDGRRFEWAGALLLTAFAYEGYLNYLGRKLFSSWESIERSLSWRSKTKLISERIGFVLEEDQKPFRTIKDLFRYRDHMAHLKPDELHEEFEADKIDMRFYERIRTEAEKFCTSDNANLCVEDVENMIILLHDSAKIGGEHPLFPGQESGSAHA
jgi:hypothetical protein